MASSDLQRQRNYVPEQNLKYHPFKKAVRSKEMSIEKMDTKDQLAEIGTKAP
eukprot:CAMPEP_0113608470 /NCGR_PEP_ID=MMETSP0017_2-20120614/3948_1 /TAXON_ID=2856 /ORGANISM="Cylindrotheca closterium" /LENGTH=51 /DNA_ID=CAMNT_0000517169 /DNA_START=1866 /DNA_END=2021 /DNA_ORIENTATION=- /assembly_acc=CAM_ASM_000147